MNILPATLYRFRADDYDDKQLRSKLLHWFSAPSEWSMAELVDIARRWQAVEPDSEDAHYYL